MRINKDKICPKCNEFKLAKEFYQARKNKLEAAGSWCKSCMKQQVVERQRRYKQAALSYKGNKCEKCGFDKYAGALEIHHLDAKTKDFGMSSFSKHPLTEKGKKELDKCILLCSNCHRMTHAGLI